MLPNTRGSYAPKLRPRSAPASDITIQDRSGEYRRHHEHAACISRCPHSAGTTTKRGRGRLCRTGEVVGSPSFHPCEIERLWSAANALPCHLLSPPLLPALATPPRPLTVCYARARTYALHPLPSCRDGWIRRTRKHIRRLSHRETTFSVGPLSAP
ncbi:hypothetical protein BC834DRAFT_638734 [Gloeopeniophorella convolvens]|nr:hypothetical protein BC834DRAFT_638734 [Gloeopeniophorella convolvens]